MRDSSGVDTAMEVYRYEPGELRYGFPCNAGGHYDEEFAPGEFTVVSIGDSFSLGVVPHWYHFTTVCERHTPGAQVHNLGRVGIGPGGYLRLLREEGLALQPDLVLINLFLGNDLMESLRWNNPSSLLGSWLDRRNVLTFQLPSRLAKLASAGGERGRAPGSLPGEYQLQQLTTDLDDLRAAFPWLDQPLEEPEQFSESAFLDIEATRALRIRDGR